MSLNPKLVWRNEYWLGVAALIAIGFVILISRAIQDQRALTELRQISENPQQYFDNPFPDPWGSNYYRGERNEGQYVASAGRDRIPGNEDDILVYLPVSFSWKRISHSVGKATGNMTRGFFRGLQDDEDAPTPAPTTSTTTGKN